MTLDEFKSKLLTEKNIIDDLLRKYKRIQENSVTTDDIREGRRNAEIFSAKLDLINWFINEADKIEITKPKMREFL